MAGRVFKSFDNLKKGQRFMFRGDEWIKLPQQVENEKKEKCNAIKVTLEQGDEVLLKENMGHIDGPKLLSTDPEDDLVEIEV